MTELDRDYCVKITGQPAPKGSMKCIGARGKQRHVLVEDNTHTAPWRARIVKAGAVFPVTDVDGAIGVEVTITVDRPKAHYRTGRNAHILKDSAPTWPHYFNSSADVDKYARTVLDGLADARLYGNDVQVVELTARKCYPDSPCTDRLPRPGAVIRLYPMEAT